MNNVSFLPDIQYSENGFVFSFLRALKDIKIKKTDGYNAENEEKTIKNAKNVSESQLPTSFRWWAVDKEISCFRKKYPVISTHGIVDNKGKVYGYNELKNSVDFLKYRSLNYYLVLEKKTR